MNQATREAILRGVAGAAETHQAFRLRETHESGLRAIDVFGLIEDLQIPLTFMPLEDLLGACVRVSTSEVGILLTTQRDLHMQRYTGAHEFGHFILEHEGSLDREVRMPGHTTGRDPREIEADAFAAEFLMPKWLVRAAAKRRDWWSEGALQKPDIVYQLSLRLAASYEATCWGLASHDYIPREAAEALIGNGKRLKNVKKTALRGVALEDSWADVWVLGAGDDGARLEAGPNDIFVLDLEERAASGFRWDVEAAVSGGFALLDDSSSFDANAIGGPSRRRVVLKAPPAGNYELQIPLARSFSRAKAMASFRLAVSTIGARSDSLQAAPPTVH